MTGFFHSRLITGAVPQSPSPTASPHTHGGEQSKGEADSSMQNPALRCRGEAFAAGQGVWLQYDTATGI